MSQVIAQSTSEVNRMMSPLADLASPHL
ncbi:hypothetical protein ACOMHN_067580, partial [Nucella lapillus]